MTPARDPKQKKSISIIIILFRFLVQQNAQFSSHSNFAKIKRLWLENGGWGTAVLEPQPLYFRKVAVARKRGRK